MKIESEKGASTKRKLINRHIDTKHILQKRKRKKRRVNQVGIIQSGQTTKAKMAV